MTKTDEELIVIGTTSIIPMHCSFPIMLKLKMIPSFWQISLPDIGKKKKKKSVKPLKVISRQTTKRVPAENNYIKKWPNMFETHATWRKLKTSAQARLLKTPQKLKETKLLKRRNKYQLENDFLQLVPALKLETLSHSKIPAFQNLE